jgi:hypothetical protein
MGETDISPLGPFGTASDYIRCLDGVPGWFLHVDARLLMGVDALQRERGVTGDVLEIGTYKGKSAILLGHLLRERERLVVCDIFEDLGHVGQETLDEAAVWYTGLRRQEFEDQFLRFHRRLPTIWQMKSSSIDRAGLARSCRIVHIDGSHAYEDVRGDIATVRDILGPGGVAVFDDWSTAHVPGVALAIWEEFLRGDAHLLCLTPLKAYITWDTAGLRRGDVERWVSAQPDLEKSYPHRLAGQDVRTVSSAPAPRPAPAAFEMENAPVQETPEQASGTDPTVGSAPIRRRRVRRVILQLAPPLFLAGYRRARLAYRRRRGR